MWEIFMTSSTNIEEILDVSLYYCVFPINEIMYFGEDT